MIQQKASDISRFFVAGINYKKTEASVRGSFSISEKQYEAILTEEDNGVAEMFILSTCNRTEIYGVCNNEMQLIEMLCAHTVGSIDDFTSACYIKQGVEAINHLFEVAAGLESQILGDYEIIGQVKKAVKFSKQFGFIGSFTERLVNQVLESTKAIKNKTTLSAGTVSVSFAAIQYLKNRYESMKNKKVLLLGVGKIGSNTSKNLKDYLDCTDVTLINRTEEKAIELAGSLGLKHASYDQLQAKIKTAEIILVATGSETPIVYKNDVENFGKKLIIDLSVPYNVEKTVCELQNIELVNVDELSKIQDETYQKRLAEVPKARAIIAEHVSYFTDWINMRRKISAVKAAEKSVAELLPTFLTYNSYHLQCTFTKPVMNKISIEEIIKNLSVTKEPEKGPGCVYLDSFNKLLAINHVQLSLHKQTND